MTHPPTYRRRTDANHATIRDAMRDEGLIVRDLSGAGNGIPDTIVCTEAGKVCFVEIKDGSKPPSKRKLTEAQERFHAEWRGPIVVITSEQEARDFARGMIEAA